MSPMAGGRGAPSSDVRPQRPPGDDAVAAARGVEREVEARRLPLDGLADAPPVREARDDWLRQRLSASLGAGHTVERELGGGGMSRVFVAREHVLSRRVVVKVLAPELARSLSAERFTREVRLAA